MSKSMKLKLTHREEEIMRILWKLEKAFVKEIREEMNPQPPYNTVSSVVRKLETMGLIGHEVFGKTHRYYAVLKKEDYKKSSFNSMLNNYFGGSVEQLMSFFVKEENVDIEELNEILEKIKDQK
jgi:BlaI family penicillinase repressor